MQRFIERLKQLFNTCLHVGLFIKKEQKKIHVFYFAFNFMILGFLAE